MRFNKATKSPVPDKGFTLRQRYYETLIDLSVLLGNYGERLFWYARKRRDLYLDMKENKP